MAVEVFAPAKVNLTLHVTGRRQDGYHLLDSLVVFADVGDTIRLSAAGETTFRIDGPEAGALDANADNLVTRAAQLFGDPVALRLTKRLPVSSGIGGGSSDAAATLRGMATLTGRGPCDGARVLGLGADVPVCLNPVPTRMRGVGDDLVPLTGLPDLPVVLVNPRAGLSTPNVFKALTQKNNPPMPEPPSRWPGVKGTAQWLAGMRNDLEAPALALLPVIGAVRDALSARPGCLLARMSGSGATCFGLFETPERARAAARAIAAANPGWWVAPCRLGAQAAAPVAVGS